MLAVGPLFVHKGVGVGLVKMPQAKCVRLSENQIISTTEISSGLELLRVKLCTKTKTTKNDVEGNTG